MFVYGDVVYAQNSEVLTLKNCHLHIPVRPTLLFRKNLGNLRQFFGQIVYRPPWQKIARTPIGGGGEEMRGCESRSQPVTEHGILLSFVYYVCFSFRQWYLPWI